MDFSSPTFTYILIVFKEFNCFYFLNLNVLYIWKYFHMQYKCQISYTVFMSKKSVIYIFNQQCWKSGYI